VNLRTAKIQLLQLLDDKTPVDQFDVTGAFDFSDALDPLDASARSALAARPDLQAALADHAAIRDQSQAGDRERLDRSDLRRVVHLELVEQQPERPSDAGRERKHSVAHLRPQPGREKAHADRHRRSQQASEATRAQVFSDVDTAYELVRSNIELLKPYKAKYNDEALRCATP
jgi:outer membrane protein, heavy metal efflux system